MLWDSVLRMDSHGNAVVASSLKTFGSVSRTTRDFKILTSVLVLFFFNCFGRSGLEFSSTTWHSLNPFKM